MLYQIYVTEVNLFNTFNNAFYFKNKIRCLKKDKSYFSVTPLALQQWITDSTLFKLQLAAP